MTVIALCWTITQRNFVITFARDRLVQAVALMAAVVLVTVVVNLGERTVQSVLAGVVMDLRYLLIFILAYLGMRFYTGVQKRPHGVDIQKFLVWVGVGLGILGLLQVYVLPLDFLSAFGYDKATTIAPYTLIDDNIHAPRAFATTSGPNDYGAFLLLPLLVSLLMLRKSKWYGLASVIILAGLFVSSSRSAWLGTLVALAAFGMFMLEPQSLKTRRKVIAGAAAAIAGVGLMIFLSINVPAVRLQVFHSSPHDATLSEGSTAAHWSSTMSGIERVVKDPVGCGAGCAGPASFYGNQPKISENYFVQIAEEFGVVGLAAWLLIAFLVMKKLWQRRADDSAKLLLASFIGLSVIGLWLHVWADDPVSLTWWLLAGAFLGLHNARAGVSSKV